MSNSRRNPIFQASSKASHFITRFMALNTHTQHKEDHNISQQAPSSRTASPSRLTLQSQLPQQLMPPSQPSPQQQSPSALLLNPPHQKHRLQSPTHQPIPMHPSQQGYMLEQYSNDPPKEDSQLNISQSSRRSIFSSQPINLPSQRVYSNETPRHEPKNQSYIQSLMKRVVPTPSHTKNQNFMRSSNHITIKNNTTAPRPNAFKKSFQENSIKHNLEQPAKPAVKMLDDSHMPTRLPPQETIINRQLKDFQEKQQLFDLSYGDIVTHLVQHYSTQSQQNALLKQQVAQLMADNQSMKQHYEVQIQQHQQSHTQQQDTLNKLKQDNFYQEQTISSLQQQLPTHNHTQETLQTKLASSQMLIDGLQIEKRKDAQELIKLKKQLDDSLLQIKNLFKTVQGLGSQLKQIKGQNISIEESTHVISPQQLSETILQAQHPPQHPSSQSNHPRHLYSQYYNRFGVSSIQSRPKDDDHSKTSRLGLNRSQSQNQSLQERFNNRASVQ